MTNMTANLTVLEPYLGKELIHNISGLDPLSASLVIVLLSIILATIMLGILKIITRQIASRTKTELDDKLLEAAQQPVFRLIIIAGIYLAVLNFGIGDALGGVMLKLIITVFYLIIILFFGKALDVFVNYGLKDLARRTESTLDDEIIPIFHKTVGAVIWVFGIILILGSWGVDVGPFLAGLGIAGLAVSFALQSTLANIFAGISLIIDKTFRVGDKIELDTGELGVIHDISLRSTRMRTYDNELIVIPNDILAKTKIKNFTQPDESIRVTVDFSVEYGTEPTEVVKLIESAIKRDIKGIQDSPPVQVTFAEMAASSLNFQARFWVPHYNVAPDKKIEATNLIYKELNKAKIGIPFPTTTVYMKK